MTGFLATVYSKLESAIVKEHRKASLCCIIALSKHMIGYWFFVKDADWTESCPANDPGYQVLQVSLTFNSSSVSAARETCSKSKERQSRWVLEHVIDVSTGFPKTIKTH